MATSYIEYPRVKNMSLVMHTWPQGNSTHTLTFSGTATCRTVYGVLFLTGQTKLKGPIPFSLKGTSVAYTTVTGVSVYDPDNLVTAAGSTITIPTYGDSWGTVTMILFYDETSLSWTWT